jgi:hypothetical protein
MPAQVELHENSRKYTAFLFSSTVYQHKAFRCGFHNTLSSVEIALGSGDEGFVVFHTDDILVHSKSFDEHMVHLNTVIG